MTSANRDVLRVAVDAVMPLIALFALHLLLVGHDEPGGGFAAGLLASGAIALDAIAHRGDPARGGMRRPDTGLLVGSGLLMCATVATVPVLFGGPVLDPAGVTLDLGVFGTAKLTTILVFDIGVFTIVIGLATAMLDRVRELPS